MFNRRWGWVSALVLILLVGWFVVWLLAMGVQGNRNREAAQRTCIENGYVEAIYYETQGRYFCIGTNGETWQFVPVEQLTMEAE